MYDILNGWDGIESLDSHAAVAFHTIYIHLIQNLFQDELQKDEDLQKLALEDDKIYDKMGL